MLAGTVPTLSLAQITGAGAHAPSVIQTRNGTPQVNITKPSGAGVSVNTYSQFDVQKAGAILNNSPTLVGTKQAGQINGNPNIDPGQPARIILNQVNSNSPSQLRGYVEVAGNRAEVVIANSSGIVVDGGGFINTSRGILTTGRPLYGADGSLTGFNVTGGNLAVQGAGLNASDIDQVDLIARAVQANAAIHAKNLNVVTGANQVNHDTLATQVIQGDGPAPGVSIDVAQLGGMYANRIALTGTENGVGVSNAGTIGAEAAGLTLTTQGKLILTGRTNASGNIAIDARDGIENSGTTYAQQSVSASTRGTLTNSSTFSAQRSLDVHAGSVNSTGTLGAGVNNDGVVTQGGDLNVTATGQFVATGHNVAGSNATMTGGSVNLAGSTTAATGALTLDANAGDLNLSSATTSAQAAVKAGASGAVINDHGKLSGGSGVTLEVGRVSNQGGEISAQGPLFVKSSGQIANQGGELVSQGTAEIHGGAILNRQGTIQSAAKMIVAGASLDNSGGRVTSLNRDGLSVTTDGQFTNAAGTTANGAQGGLIAGNGDVTVHSGTVVNRGMVDAKANLHVTGQLVDNGGGSLKAAQSATIDAGARLTNVGGTITGQTATVNGTMLDNSSGTVQADQLSLNGTDLINHGGTITQTGTDVMAVNVSGTLDNSGGGVLQTNSTDLTLTPAELNNAGGTITHSGTGTLTITPGGGASALNNASGTIVSKGQAVVKAASLNNSGGILSAQHGLTGTITGDVNNAQGLMRSDASLSLTGGALVNRGGHIQAGQSTAGDTSTLDIQAASIDNADGSVIDLGTGKTTVQGGSQITNSHAGGVSGMGTITGNGDVTIGASSIVNSQGGQLSGASLHVQGTTLDNSGGSIGNLVGNVMNSGGDVDVTMTSAVTNTRGQIGSTHDLTVTAATLQGGGTYSATHDARVKLRGDFSVTADSRFKVGHDLAFTLPGTFNNSGNVQSVHNLSIDAGNIINSGALMAGGLLHTQSVNLTNTGSIVGGSASINATGTVSNLGPTALIGGSDSNGTLEILGHDIENRDDTAATDTIATTAIYGMGKVVLAGGKDAGGHYTNAALVNNASALIQSGGDMQLHADRVVNTRRVMKTSGYTGNVDPALLEKLGISMKGCVALHMEACAGQNVGWTDLRNEAIRKVLAGFPGGVYTEPPHGGQWNSGYQKTTYSGKAVANTVTDISPAAQIVSGGRIDAKTVGTLQNYWSNVAAVGNVDQPVNYDADGWKASGQEAPGVKVTYSGQYHYNNYDNSEHDWQLPFGDAPFTGSRPGGYAQAAPADVKQYSLPSYASTLGSSGTISGTGVSIHNTAANAPVPSLGLLPGQAVPGLTAGTLNGSATGSKSPTGSIQGGVSTTVDPVIASAMALNVLTHLTIPQGGLYRPNPAPNAGYVIETNPAFTSQKRFLSSDYFFKQIGVDLTHVPKRLGDGFYEQQLVRNQITALTGKAVLGPYADLGSMYQSLLGAGASMSKSLDLPLGMSLSAGQVARLTGNMIMMETRVVDGQSVLVPVVYLAKASQQDMNGPLITATDIDLKDAQSFTNSGTVKADNLLSIQGKQIDNAFGALQSGGLMSLMTTGNVDLTSAKVKAGSLDLNAGGDLILDTATNTTKQVSRDGATRTTTTLGPVAQLDVAHDASITTRGNFRQNAGNLSVGGNLSTDIGGNWMLGTQQTGEHKVVQRANGVSDTDVNSVTGSTVKVGGVSSIGVGGDLTARGAQIDLGQGGMIAAKGNVSLGTASATSIVNSNSSGGDHHGSYAETSHTSDQELTGTTLTGGNTVNILSGKDITLSGSAISLKKGKANLLAVGDVNVGATSETHELNSHETHSHSSVVGGSKVASGIDQTATYSQGSTISADGVKIASGKDINVTGSSVVGTNNVTLNAAHDVNINTSQDTTQSSTYYQKQDSGLLTGGGLAVTFGSRSTAQQDQSSTVTNNASVVGSSNGNVSISAGKDAAITGSTVVAGQNIGIMGQNVTVNAAYDTYKNAQSQQFSQSGLSVGLGGGLVGLGQTMAGAVRQGTRSGDSRLAAVQGVAAAEQAYRSRSAIAGAASALSGGNVSEAAKGVQVQISIGSSHDSSNATTSITSAKGSSLIGNGNVSITATGTPDAEGNAQAGTGNIAMTGATVLGKNVALDANDAITLQSAQSTERDTSSNSSSGWNAGAAIGVGKNTGISVFANGSNTHGQGNGSSVTQTDTTVAAGNTLTIKSGGDTTLAGARVSGDKVKADVGGNLTMTSLQDTSDYSSNQHSAGVSGSFTFGTGGGAEASIGHTGIDSNYASVNQQTGIVAGKGGFDVNVAGHTQLNGAEIASAAPADSNTLTTGSLGFTDVQNRMSYSGKSQGFSTFSGPSFAQTSDSASGVTHAAVSPAKIVVKSGGQSGTDSTSGLSRDTANANQTVQNTFNLQKVQNNLAFAQAFGKVATFAVAEAATQLENSSPQMKALFGEGGAGRDALHAAVAAIGAALSGGNIGGAVAGSLTGDVLQSLAQPIIDQAVGQLPLSAQKAARNALNEIVVTAGGAAGGALAGGGSSGALAGAGSAINNELYNRQLHESEADRLTQLQKGQTPDEQYRLAAAECALVQCAAGIPDSDPSKATLQKLQDAGQNFTAEQNTLKNVGAFDGYGSADSFVDWADRNQVSNRAVGAVQGVGGAVAAAGAVGAGCATLVACGLGATVATTSLDYSKAGFTQMLSGNVTQTYGEQVLQSLGLSPKAAALAYGAINLGSAAGTAIVANQSSQATNNAPLGPGSTGRAVPNNLQEQLALQQAMSNPTAGVELPILLGDSRWPAADGWVKMSQNVNGVEIHYVRNTSSGAVDDFKFK